MAAPSAESSTLALFNNTSFKKKEKTELTCSYYGKSGHVRDKCYRLIGFPPNFKFTKIKQGQFSNNFPGPHSSNKVMSPSQEKEFVTVPQLSLTRSQIQKLMAQVNGQAQQPTHASQGPNPTPQSNSPLSTP